MKQYKEDNFGLEYHVIEYDNDDGSYGSPSLSLLENIISAKNNFKYLKIIDRMTNEVNYYMDGMKHNDFGPSTILNDSEKFYINDKKVLDKSEFVNWKRSKLINKIIE